MKKSCNCKFKSRVALEALRGDLTVAEIAGKYQIHPNLVQQWKKKLHENASDFFLTKVERKAEKKPYSEDDLMEKIGRLEVENDFLQSVSLACGLSVKKQKSSGFKCKSPIEAASGSSIKFLLQEPSGN